MKTKAKVLISIIAVCVILVVAVLSVVIALTEPTHLVDKSNLYISYTQGKVAANVDITRKDTRLYYLEDGTATSSVDLGEEHSYAISLASVGGKSEGLNLGEFNPGQALDKTRASSELIIDISLLNGSSDTAVQLTYSDANNKDSNVRLVVTSVMYKGNVEADSYTQVFDLVNGNWAIQNGVLFNSSDKLTLKNGAGDYSSIKITVRSELVSYADNCRLDGTFNLSLTV